MQTQFQLFAYEALRQNFKEFSSFLLKTLLLLYYFSFKLFFITIFYYFNSYTICLFSYILCCRWKIIVICCVCWSNWLIESFICLIPACLFSWSSWNIVYNSYSILNILILNTISIYHTVSYLFSIICFLISCIFY